jgi:YtkA-like
MIRFTHAVTILAAVTSAPAWAGADDYRFELVAPPSSGEASAIKVRLLQLPDKKPVPDAVVFETRFDMGPDGMPTMTAPVQAVPDKAEPGVYVFRIEPSMAGKWALTLAAKVQGEPETVRGSLTIPVPK